MSYFLEVKNRAVSSLASGVTDVATSWGLAAGEGAKFPTAGDFHVTCENEIVKVTARSTDTLTVVRAQEGTTGVAHDAGKAVELRITAGIITEIQGKKAIAGWTADKLLKGAGAGVDPTEIDDYTQGARVYHSVVQSIPNATDTVIAFDSEDYDTDTIHDCVTNNSRLTCKTAGKYAFVGIIRFVSNATGFRIARVKKNGTDVALLSTNATNGDCTNIEAVGIVNLAVNEYLQLYCYQNSGGALDVQGGAADYRTQFMMQRIG